MRVCVRFSPQLHRRQCRYRPYPLPAPRPLEKCVSTRDRHACLCTRELSAALESEKLFLRTVEAMTKGRASSPILEAPHQHEEEAVSWQGFKIFVVSVQGRRHQCRHLNPRAEQHDDGGSTSRQIFTRIISSNLGATTERRRRCLFKRTSAKRREGQDQHQQHQRQPKRRE